MILTTLLSAALVAAPAPQQPSVKELLDYQLATLRLTQNEDGSYGRGLIDTAHVVTALSLGPRAYRAEDGPFLSRAVAYLLAHAPAADADLGQDAKVIYALQSSDREIHAALITKLTARLPEPSATAVPTAMADLALPGWSSTQAVEHLMAIPDNASISVRALACARGAVAYRKAQQHQLATAKAPKVDDAYERGVDFLLGEIGESGMWEAFGRPEPGISALAARALLDSSRAEVHQRAYAVLDLLRALQKEDGSIHSGRVPVYVTSVALGALAAGGRPVDQEAVKRAANYLRAVQSDGDEGYSESDKFYGGIGYGNDLRPDLSNLQYALQGMHDSGAEADDPAYQRALLFLERCQNLKEVNTGTFRNGDDPRPVRSGDDGGGIYMPGSSMAGYDTQADGSLVARSYGSMTYALLKCYVFAGLDGSDPRVAAAIEWIARHWTLEVNPGFDGLRDPRAAAQGLYYYYLSLAQALSAAEVKELTTPDGARHNWRLELALKLIAVQKEDGSWINLTAERWWEGNPVLCTAYALNALALTQPAAKE